MKNLKVTKAILLAISVAGGFLVTEGILTGEELAYIQNVIGMILGGGGLTALALITTLAAIPKTFTDKAYDKAVAVYGKDKVDNLLNGIVETKELVKEIIPLMERVLDEIAFDRKVKQELGVYESLEDSTKQELENRM